MDILTADGITAAFDPAGGIIAELAISFEGNPTIRPLHIAPWASEPQKLPEHVPPIERKLRGDFFCAPFAVAGEDTPLHGWSANSDWDLVKSHRMTTSGDYAIYRLRQEIHGSALTKKLSVRHSHPFIYQVHTFEGGQGTIPIAHHAMLHVPGGVALSFSQKINGKTGHYPPETDDRRGRSVLSYPQTFTELGSVRRADGRLADASVYPFEQQHEDVIVLTESPASTIGWSAAVAANDGFVFLALKDATVLPQTVLWLSNGGRYYEPWSGRHTEVIGIEEASVGFHLSDREREGELAATGLQLRIGATTSIRYAFGAIPVPTGWSRVKNVRLREDSVVVEDISGESKAVPFDQDFFSRRF